MPSAIGIGTWSDFAGQVLVKRGTLDHPGLRLALPVLWYGNGHFIPRTALEQAHLNDHVLVPHPRLRRLALRGWPSFDQARRRIALRELFGRQVIFRERQQRAGRRARVASVVEVVAVDAGKARLAGGRGVGRHDDLSEERAQDHAVLFRDLEQTAVPGLHIRGEGHDSFLLVIAGLLLCTAATAAVTVRVLLGWWCWWCGR
mmetsp:Transcript_20598/g.46568  ORF Transcript_20598/g.46568 Transcript_20598/m.46568 type:complete len:202 (-) Transcript_20598:189-794(-)